MKSRLEFAEMEFHGRRRRNVKTEYVTNLQLYKIPPVETISLQEFEELAEQRLKRKIVT